jgi:hypothetical protein
MPFTKDASPYLSKRCEFTLEGNKKIIALVKSFGCVSPKTRAGITPDPIDDGRWGFYVDSKERRIAVDDILDIQIVEDKEACNERHD